MVAVVYFLAVVSTSRAVSEIEGKLIVCNIILLFRIMKNQGVIILSALYHLMTNISYAAIAADD